MTGGLLDFFMLEATEYVDHLDALVSGAPGGAPDADALARPARALRGAATMAKRPGIAEVAGGLERLARALREREVGWDAEVRGAAIAAVDDLKILLRGVRTWGAEEEERASRRVAELDVLAPRKVRTITRGKGAEFLAGAAAEAATGLLSFAEQPGSLDDFAETMRKVRALRGVAALRDLPPLAEVVDAIDAAAKALELRQEEATADRRRLFRTAARVLLEGGDAIRHGGLPPTDSPAVREFAHAAETLRTGARESDQIVPISSLFPEGPAESFVEPGQDPPTTATERFRLEVVSQAEHLRRLVADGRSAVDAATRDRVGRDMRRAVRALADAAQSFGAREVAQLFHAAEAGAADLESRALWVLDEAGTELSQPLTDPAAFGPRFDALLKRLMGTPPVPQTSTPARQRRSGSTPAGSLQVGGKAGGASGSALRDLLSAGIAGLEPLGTQHLAARAGGDDDDIVPIDELLYRGRDALARAIALGEELRRAPEPDGEALAELYDLLQLAAAD